MENQTGVMNDVIKVLSDAGINLRAFSVAEGIEFGILRLLVSDEELAQSVLQKEGFTVKCTDVLRVKLPDEIGGLSRLLACLAREGVFIQYMYAFSEGDSAYMVMRTNDMERCVDVLNNSEAELKAISPLYKI